MSVSRTLTVLFLHGGPGLTCQMERDQYGDSFPVHWWEQPHFLNDFITRGPPSPVTWRGSANVWIGRHDPYALPSDAEAWRVVLPNASVQFVDAGHFPHLELPPTLWQPRA